MKRTFSAFFSAAAALFPSASEAIIVYGESNGQAAADYASAENPALASVVAVSDSSAVYLGNGWFLTANHVSISDSTFISQNGQYAKVSHVDNTLNSSFGADLKLFYVDGLESFTSLASANIATADAYSALTTVSFGAARTGNAYNLTYSEGTHLTLAGAGYGRSDSSALDAETVASDGIKGTVRSGESSLFAMQNLNGAKTLITMAEATPGSAQAQSGDSGGGMFAQFENEWYLVGTITGVSPNISTSTAIFGSYGEASLTYGSDGRPNGVDTSALLENSLTIATSLEDYAETISSIIATNPIPEPLESAILSGAGAFALAIAARRRRK
ncbi:MAG: hypothetical protein DBY30_08040 [Verrucomicrobia bacterium]|nr:MAG: hypothetical protein DBY30_08040 [Verrucomicrobiota bacterium]